MGIKDIFKKKNIKKDSSENKESSLENSTKENNSKKRRFKKRYIPLIIICVLIIAVIGARIYLNNDRVKTIVENVVYSSLNRKLVIEKFSYGLLFPKIEASNITLYNSTNFNEAENISLDNLRLRFSLFQLFFLRLHVKELSIDNLYVNMFTDEAGNWNLPDMPPSEPKVEDTNKEPFDFTKLDFLKLKADIENIRINNLSFSADSLSYVTNNSGLFASLSNFNLHLDLNTKRFALSKVMGVSAPEVLKKLNIKSFISNDLVYNNSALNFKDEPLFNLDISYPNEDEIKIVFDFEVSEPNLRYNGIKKDDMQLAFNLLARYNVKTQSVFIDNISSDLLNDEVLKVIASATNIFNSNIGIDLNTFYARLDLGKLNSLTSMFMPALGINMNGLLNVDADKTTGTINNLNNKLTIAMKNINFDMQKTISIKNLNSTTVVDLIINPEIEVAVDNKLTIERATALRRYRFNNANVALRVDSSLNGLTSIATVINDPNKKSDAIVYIDDISAKYGNANILLKGLVRFDEPTDLKLNVSSLPVADFSGGLARGSLNLDANIFGKLLSDIDLNLKGIINNFSYNLNGEVSSTTKANINMLANANIISQDINVSEFNIDLGNFFNFKSYLNLQGMGLKSGFVNVHTLRIAPYAMKNWLSTKFAELVDGLPFEDDVKLTSAIAYNLSLEDTFASVTNYTTVYVTEKQYKLQDVTMQVDADVNFGENLYANIRKFNIDSPTNNLKVRVDGYFTPVIKNADLNYEVGLDTDSLYLPFGIEIGGLLSIIGNLKNNIADGDLIADNFFANMDSPDKMSILLKGLDSNIDYHFDLTPNKNQVVSTAARYNPLTSQVPNLFIDQLRVYLKIHPFIDDSIRIMDFSSSVRVQGHGLTIQDLKSSLYIGGEKFNDNLFLASISNNTAPRRGAIHLPWLNVDLGSFDTSTIKYDMRMLASDINFKYLLPPENRDKINDEKLLVNLTADIAGVGISPLNNIRPTTFFVGISKMSTEFSKFLIEMIRPINPGISTVENIVQFGYDPNSVEFSISANKVFTTFYFRDQNLDKPNQQKQQLIAFEGDKFGLEPMPFSDVISYLEGGN